MVDIRLPALSPQDVLPRGENLCKYYILEGIYYLHLLQDPKQSDDFINRVIDLSQQLNVSFQGRSVEALGVLMSETLRKLILVLQTTSLTKEVIEAVQILYNKTINLKLHQMASLLGRGAQEMWKTIKVRDNRSNPLDILYSQTIDNCQITINDKRKNKSISIEEYLNNVLAPNIRNIVANSSDIIRTVSSKGIENITLDDIYEVHMLCSDSASAKPAPIIINISEHLTGIMAGFFTVVSVIGFRLLVKLSYASDVKRIVRMERIKYETNRFLFRDRETYQRYKQDIKEANRQLGRGIMGLAGGLVSPFYSAIKSHPLGRLLVGMGEFGFKQAYLRTGRFLGAGYRKSGFSDYYESRIPSAFDSEEAWSYFGSKTQTEHRMEYEKGQAFRQLKKLLKDATNNPKYEDDSNVLRLLNQPRLNDAVIHYNNLMLKGFDKLNDREKDALERYKETIRNFTGLKDEGAIRKFVELYFKYRTYQGLVGMRNMRNESNTAFFAPPNKSGVGTTTYTTGQLSGTSGSALPSTSLIEQSSAFSIPSQQASMPENVTVQKSRSLSPKFTSWRQKFRQMIQTQSYDISGSESQQEVQSATETLSSTIQDFANKLANAITRSLPQNLSNAIPLITSAVTEVVQSNIAKTQERVEAGVQPHDLDITKKEIRAELLDKICDVIKCVNKDANRSAISSEELAQLLTAIDKQEKEISELVESIADTVDSKSKSQKDAGSDSNIATGSEVSGSLSGTAKQAANKGSAIPRTSPAIPSSITPTAPSVPNISNTQGGTSSPTPSSTTQPTPRQKPKSPAKTQVSKQASAAPLTGSSTITRPKSKRVPKSRFRPRMTGYLARKAKSILGKRAGTAVAAEGLAGLAGSQGMVGALRMLAGGGRMLGMLANPLGIALGVGLLGLAGYGGYKIFTKAILPQIQGKGFSFVEDKRRETIDSIIAKIGNLDDQKLQETRDRLNRGVRVSLVGGGSADIAREARTWNTSEIRLSGKSSNRGIPVTQSVDVTTMPAIPEIQTLSTPQTTRQFSPEQQEKIKQQEQKMAEIMNNQQHQGDAQRQAQAYNQAVINDAVQSNNLQLTKVLQLQNDLMRDIISQLNQLKQEINSNPSPITGP